MPSSTFLTTSFSFMKRSSSTHSFGPLPDYFLNLLGVDRLDHLCNYLYFGAMCHREHIAIKMDCAPLVLGLREHLSRSPQHTQTLISNHQLNPVQSTTVKSLKEADPANLVLFHVLRVFRISRYPSLLTTITTREWLYSQTLRSSCGGDRCHPHMR